MPSKPRAEAFDPTPAMEAEVGAFLDRHEPEPAHTRQVCRLALELFDQLGPRHGLGAGARFILEAAALLHDVGWSVAPDGRRHHKIAQRMILEHRWAAVPAPTVPLIALVARYHRKAVPRPGHEGYDRLDEPGRATVRRLAAILRVADALDRSHGARVTGIRVEDRGRAVVLHLAASGPCPAELAVAEEKKDLFEAEFGAIVEFAVG